MTIGERLPPAARTGVTAVVSFAPILFARRLVVAILADDIPGLAAQMSYQYLFALFPFLVFLAALAGFIGAQVGQANLFSTVMSFVEVLAPPEVQELVRDWVYGVIYTRSPELLTLGAAGCLLGAMGGIATLVKGLDRAYQAPGGRPLWKAQIVALVAVGALAVVMIGGAALFTIGEWAGERLARELGRDQRFLTLWGLLRGPGIVIGLCLVLVGLYAALPNVRLNLRQAAPGAVFATAAWGAVTTGFSTYLAHFGGFNLTYGSIGFVILLLIWLYAVGAILLIGGEINALLSGHRADGGGAQNSDATGKA